LLHLLLSAVARVQSSDQVPADKEGLQKSLEEYRLFTSQNPNNPMGWVKLAVTLQELDHHMPDGGSRVLEAVTAYSKALQLGLPDEVSVTLYGNLGALLMGAGHSHKAIDAFDTGLKLREDAGLPLAQSAGLLYNRGKALGYLGKEKASRESYLRAVECAEGSDPHIYVLAAVSLKSANDTILRGMENAARFLSGDYNALIPEGTEVLPKSSASKLGIDKSAREAMVQQLAWLKAIRPVDIAYLHMGLYQMHSQRGDEDTAWEHLGIGNALYRQMLGDYSLRAEGQLMQMIMSVFRGQFGGGGFHDRTPIFVTGVPRSGSTLIEQILASHSQVWGAGEDTAMAPIIGTMMSEMNSIPESAQLEVLVSYGKKYVDEMLSRVPDGRHVTRIVDKMLRNLWNVGQIHMMLPDSCIIYAVRHPIDTAVSCFEQPFEGRGTPWAWDMDEIADYIMLNAALARHWSRVLPGRLLTVMYEDLVANQEAVTREILSHCGLEFEEQVLNFHQLERGVQTASLSQVRKRMYTTSVLKYKRYDKHIQPLLAKLSPLAALYEQQLEDKQREREAARSAPTSPSPFADEL